MTISILIGNLFIQNQLPEWLHEDWRNVCLPMLSVAHDHAKLLHMKLRKYLAMTGLEPIAR